MLPLDPLKSATGIKPYQNTRQGNLYLPDTSLGSLQATWNCVKLERIKNSDSTEDKKKLCIVYFASRIE